MGKETTEQLTHLQYLIKNRNGLLDVLPKLPRRSAKYYQTNTHIRSLNDQILRLTIVENHIGKLRNELDTKTKLYP